MGSKHKKNKAKKKQSKQTAASERRRRPAVRVAPKRPRRTSLDEPIRLQMVPRPQNRTFPTKEHRERQGGLWGRGVGCGRTAHIWSYDPGPITRPQTHILRAFCRLTSPRLAHRRDGDSPGAAADLRPRGGLPRHAALGGGRRGDRPRHTVLLYYDARPRDPFYDEERELAEVR